MDRLVGCNVYCRRGAEANRGADGVVIGRVAGDKGQSILGHQWIVGAPVELPLVLHSANEVGNGSAARGGELRHGR